MKPIIVSCCLFVAFCLSACDTSTEEPLPPLVPDIQLGDIWIMDKEIIIGSDFPDPPLSETIERDTFRVEEVIEIGETTWYRIENRLGDGLFSLFRRSQSYYSFRDDGIWQLDVDSSEVHIFHYPEEPSEEFQVTEGLFTSLANTDTLYTLPEGASVPAIRFQNRYSTAFKPFEDIISRPEFQSLPLERQLIKNTYFSSEFGLLRSESFYVTARNELIDATIVGSFSSSLVAYIPAASQ